MNRRSFFEMLGTASVALGLAKTASAAESGAAEAKLKSLGIVLPEAARPERTPLTVALSDPATGDGTSSDAPSPSRPQW